MAINRYAKAHHFQAMRVIGKMAKFKITNPTAKSDEPSLCLSCKHALVIRGEKLDDNMIQCDELYSVHAIIRHKVVQCNKYLDSNHPSLREMEDIAWVIRTDPRTRKIGFVPSKDLKTSERFKLSNDYD